MSAVTDMSGVTIAGVTCIAAASVRGVWVWRCHCGKLFERRGSRIRHAAKSQVRTGCGCDHIAASIKNGKANRTHGRASGRDRKLYDVWRQMHRRCEDPTSTDFRAYGARGISVCEEWSDVGAFCDWARSSGYAQGVTIERRDVNGGYNPENCHWIVMIRQFRNMRKNVFIEHFGKRLTISEWSRETGIHVQTLRQRIRNGWNSADLLTVKPVLGRNQARAV